MKVLITAAVAILCSVSASSAEGQRFGGYVGVSATRAYPEPLSAEWRPVNMFTMAAFAEFGNGVVRVRPELQLLRRGGAQADHRASIEMTHLVLPLLITVSPIRAPAGIRPVAYAGPTMGIRIGCTGEQVTIEGDITRQDCMQAGWENGQLELGTAFGGGLHVPIGRGGLMLEMRHARTFGGTGDPSEYQQIRGSATSLVAGVAVGVR